MLGLLRLRLGRVGVLAAAASALALMTGGAAAAWLAAGDLSQTGTDTEKPRVAIDKDGNTVAVWRKIEGQSVIQASTRAGASGTWSAPRTLSAEGGTATSPDVATDGSGQTTVVWRRDNGVRYVIQAVTRAADGTWGPVQDLSFSDENAHEPDVAVSAGGTTVVVWRRYEGGTGKFVIQTAVRVPGGPWTSPQTISDPSVDAFFPHAAVDGFGNAVVVWRRDPGGSCSAGRCSIQAVYRPVGGAWSSPQTISNEPTRDTRGPTVAMGRGGDAVAVWHLDGDDGVVQAVARPFAAGAWQSPQTISPAGQPAFNAKVIVDASGAATAAWVRVDGSHDIIQSAERRNGTWSAAQNVSAPGQDAREVDLAGDDEGNAVAVWWRSDGSNTIIQSAQRPAGGPWQDLSNLSLGGRSADEPATALSANGTAAAVWVRNDGTNNITQGTLRTSTGPVLLAVNVPAVARISQDVTMSVQTAPGPFPLAGAPQWTFGDGTSGSGYTVRHAYTRAGTFTVTISQTDAQGNTVSAQRAVSVLGTGTLPFSVRITGLSVAPKILVKLGKTRNPARVRYTANRKVSLDLTIRKAGKPKVVVARTRIVAKKGRNSFLLKDVVGGRRLTAGKYSVSLTTRKPAKLQSPVRFTLTVR